MKLKDVGVILNPETRKVRLAPLRMRSTLEGTLASHGGKEHLLTTPSGYILQRKWYDPRRPRIWYLLLDGDATPLNVSRQHGIHSPTLPDGVLFRAMRSHIPDRVLREGLRWEIVAMIALGIIAALAIIVR